MVLLVADLLLRLLDIHADAVFADEGFLPLVQVRRTLLDWFGLGGTHWESSGLDFVRIAN